jgi:ADP-ribosylglycohydrolase
MDEDIKYKIILSILFHCLGDTIGFKNGDWEFYGIDLKNNLNKNYFENTLEIIYQFIESGGFSGLDIKGWLSSDDTLSHIALIKSLLTNYKNKDDLSKKFSKELCEIYSKDKFNNNRRWGYTTKNIILKLLNKKQKWNDNKYDNSKGGSGSAMRTLCLGLIFNCHTEKKNLQFFDIKKISKKYNYPNDYFLLYKILNKINLKKLIEYSVETSIVTHHSTFGILGGFVSALFTSFAITDIKVEYWSIILVKSILENENFDKIIKTTSINYELYLENKNKYINKWIKYNDFRFMQKNRDTNLEKEINFYNSLIINRSDKNLFLRIKKLYQLFTVPEGMSIDEYHKKYINDPNFIPFFPGSNGCDSVIMAYDSLLMSNGSFEKLIYYSMLHCGDSDTVGCISAGWFGAYYGSEKYFSNFFNHKKDILVKLEFYNELLDLSVKLFKKYY